MANTGSQQVCKLFHRQASFTNDFAQSAFGHFLMIRHGNATVRRKILALNDVTAALMIKYVANFRQRFDDVLA